MTAPDGHGDVDLTGDLVSVNPPALEASLKVGATTDVPLHLEGLDLGKRFRHPAFRSTPTQSTPPALFPHLPPTPLFPA